MRDRRAGADRGAPARRHPYLHRPRQAARRQPPAAQMHRRRRGACGVQRQDHGAPRRAAHRLFAVEPQPAADSARAHVDTKPQLEIFADDVKCAHGATVGQLDGEEVFYLQSRGLSDVAARNLLTYAFGAEVIDRIPVASLKHRLEQARARTNPAASHDRHPTATKSRRRASFSTSSASAPTFRSSSSRSTASRWSISTTRRRARCRSR